MVKARCSLIEQGSNQTRSRVESRMLMTRGPDGTMVPIRLEVGLKVFGHKG